MLKIRALAALMLAVPGAALAADTFVMHRDVGCPCCAKWAAQLRQQFGRAVQVVDDTQRPALQARLGIPRDLSSCHTVVIGGYAIEGHVPFADIKRLLAQRPAGVRGIAVPGMPAGSPGMEMPGGGAQRYDVIAFGPKLRRVFARHG